MARRTRYLVAYDIRAPRRLRRVHQVALAYGYPLQYSLFACDLTPVELVALKRDMLKEIQSGVDSVAVFDLGPARSRGIECVEYLGARREVPDADEPMVW